MLKADKIPERVIVNLVCKYFPAVQAIYLFGSYGTDDEWPSSDIDMALLLAPVESKRVGVLELTELISALRRSLGKEVDLINLRSVSTVLKKEIIAANRRIYCTDDDAADEFEMLTISFFQKLNEERAELLDAFFSSGRAYLS